MLGGEHLAGDFRGVEVAGESGEAGGAEFAAVGAADLGGDAERAAVGLLAVERRVGRDEHAFDVAAVVQAEEELAGGVGGALGGACVRARSRRKVAASFSRSAAGRLVIASKDVTFFFQTHSRIWAARNDGSPASLSHAARDSGVIPVSAGSMGWGILKLLESQRRALDVHGDALGVRQDVFLDGDGDAAQRVVCQQDDPRFPRRGFR